MHWRNCSHFAYQTPTRMRHSSVAHRHRCCGSIMVFRVHNFWSSIPPLASSTSISHLLFICFKWWMSTQFARYLLSNCGLLINSIANVVAHVVRVHWKCRAKFASFFRFWKYFRVIESVNVWPQMQLHNSVEFPIADSGQPYFEIHFIVLICYNANCRWRE